MKSAMLKITELTKAVVRVFQLEHFGWTILADFNIALVNNRIICLCLSACY
jgi:hypothetical protein